MLYGILHTLRKVRECRIVGALFVWLSEFVKPALMLCRHYSLSHGLTSDAARLTISKPSERLNPCECRRNTGVTTSRLDSLRCCRKPTSAGRLAQIFQRHFFEKHPSVVDRVQKITFRVGVAEQDSAQAFAWLLVAVALCLHLCRVPLGQQSYLAVPRPLGYRIQCQLAFA